jgi:WD40 repeat protein
MNSESWLRAQYQTVIKQRDELQYRYEQLARENQDLRRSVSELSFQLSQLTPTNFCQLMERNHPQGLGFNRRLLDPPVSTAMSEKKTDHRNINFECELRGHAGAVYCIDITKDNKWIASGSIDKLIVIWKGTFPYKQVGSLNGHTQLVSGVCWDSNLSLAPVERKGTQPTITSTPILYSSSFDKTVGSGSCRKSPLPPFNFHQRFEFGTQCNVSV